MKDSPFVDHKEHPLNMEERFTQQATALHCQLLHNLSRIK